MSQNPSTSIETPGESDPPASMQDSPGSSPPAESVGRQEESASDKADMAVIVGVTADLDKLYTGFDPSIHAIGKDGGPIMRKGGGFQLKRGRKAGSAASAPTVAADGAVTQASAQAPAASGQTQISNKEAAAMLCGLAEGGLIALLGEEWEADAVEARGLAKSTQAYLDATGGLDMSPGVGLLFAWGGYAVPRFSKPKTQGKLKQFGAWLGGLFRRPQK